MRTTRKINGVLLLFLCSICLASCQKEEKDFLSKETEDCTVIEGIVQTTDGLPLAGIEVTADYHRNVWLYSYLVRHKAKARTGKNGKYRLFFYINDDEQKEEKDVSRYFSLSVNLKQLDAKKYILPSNMGAEQSTNPSVDDTPPMITTSMNSLERSTTYTKNYYIPQIRYIQITLKGFIPVRQNDRFELYSMFPYGGESNYKDKVLDTKYGIRTIQGMYYSSSEEQTFEVLTALNENNVIRLIKCKDGVYTIEDHQLLVTKDSPKSLIYEY